MDLENGVNLKTSLTVANNVRKTRAVLFGCCKGEKSDSGVTIAPKSLVDMVAIASFGVSAFTMLSTAPMLIDIAGLFLLFFSPYLAYQKRMLNELGTFRSLHNRLRERVNELMIQNDILTSNVDRLEGSVNELEEVEMELSNIANSNNVDRLVYVVSETKRINEKMKKNMQAKIVQQLVTTVLRTDRDLDLKIGPRELKNLMMRLDAHPGFDFHKENFMKLLGNTTEPVPIGKIMNVIRNLKDDNIADADNIFTMNQESLKKGSNRQF